MKTEKFWMLAALGITTELQNEPQNKGWKELEQLLKYAYDK